MLFGKVKYHKISFVEDIKLSFWKTASFVARYNVFIADKQAKSHYAEK